MPPVAAIIAGISLTAVLESVAISLVSSLVIGGLTQLLGGQSQTKPGVQPHTETIKQPLLPWQVIYGRARVGGAWVYIHTTGNPVIGQNSALMGAIVLACHPCDAIEKIYFGDQEVQLDSTGNAMGIYRNYVHIWKHLGWPGQAADPNLIQWSDGLWTGAHRIDGRCYIAIDLAYNKDLFPSMPVISAQIRGKVLLDFRDGGSRWSNNPVLCIADYLYQTDYGMGYPAYTELDLDNFNSEANHCDEIVQSPGAGGGWRMPQDHFIAETSKKFNSSNITSKTISSAFTINSDTLGLDTGNRIMLTGNALPAGVAANTSYWVIRQPDGLDYVYEQLNLNRTPVLQLAASYANATAAPPIPLTISSGGSGTIWRLDDLWLTWTDTKNLYTGDMVQVFQADANPLPSPLVAGNSYYWIDRGHQNIYYETNHALLAYGHGMLASTAANAAAGNGISLGVGIGVYVVGKYYEKRFTCNGVVDTSKKPSDILAELLSCCGAQLVRASNKWRIFTATWRGVTDTLTDADMRGPVKVNTLVSRRDLFNSVRGTYISPGNNDQPSDFPPYPDPSRPDLDIFLAEDGGERIFSQSIQLPFTQSSGMAQRLAKILLMQVRKQISVIFQAKLTAFGISAGEVVQVSSTRMGWSNKTFEVVDWTLALAGGSGTAAPTPGIDITLRETDPAVFDWQNGMETTGWWAPRTNLPQVWYVPAPVITSVIEELRIVKTGGGRESYAHIYWGAIADGFAGYYQVGQWDAANPAAVGYQDLQTAGTGTENVVGPLAPGETYCFVVRALNILNISSPWSAPVCLLIQGVTEIPPDIQNFHVQPIGDKAHVTWNLSTDVDVLNGGYIELRWSADTVGATWLTATALDLLLAGTATEATILLKAGTYLAKQVNSSGIKSTNAVTWVILVVDVPGWHTVATVTESPIFPGAKTQLIVDNENLQLASTGAGSIVDTWPMPPGVDGIPDWDGAGGADSDGEYDFSVITDLGAVFGFRIDLTLFATEIGNSVWGDQASATIKAQIATTQDPPNGPSPTWTDWQPLLIGDFVARGVKRRLLFHTYDPHASIACSQLSDVIMMFSRTWTLSGVSIPATGAQINFSPAFYQTPVTWGDVDAEIAGDYVQVTLADRTGAYFTIRNAAGTAKAGTADLTAVGIGSQMA